MAKAKVATSIKKKPGDFKRPKRKVGRKAPQAANVTSVGITSRRINLLEQSVLQDKGDAATTHRNLTLHDLLQQIGHYNAHIRQRAVQGLRELAQLHASNVLANVSVLLDRFLPTFVDEEAIVREAAVATWKVLIPVLHEGKTLKPFAKLIAVYFCSGLTHLQIGVRQDTLRAIGALLEVSPEVLSIDAGVEQLGRLLENFCDLIAAVQTQGIKVTNSYDLLTTSTNKKKQASENARANGGSEGRKKKKSTSSAMSLRFAGLKVLYRLLSSIDFSDASAGSDSRKVIKQSSSARSSSVLSTSALLLYAKPVLVAGSQSEQLRQVGFWQQKSRCLLGPLLDLWVECTANDVETLSEDYIEHMQFIVECATTVISANAEFMASQSDSELRALAMKMQDQLLQTFPMFPSTNISNSDDAYLSRWYGINVALTRFACVFLQMPSAFQSSDLEERVVAFVLATLAKYESSDDLRSLASTQQIMRSLLEVLALVLSTSRSDASKAEQVEQLLTAFTQFYVKCSRKSVTFRTCTSFVVEQIVVLKPWPKWSLIMQWMTCFGHFLGRLDTAHIELGRQCLFTMISVFKQLPVEQATGEQMDAIMSNLVQFFSLASSADETDESMEDADEEQQQQITESGKTHFDALQGEDQMEFVALVYHLPHYPVELLRALANCCKSDAVHVDAKSFLMDILHQRSESLDLAHLVSFLMSSVLARSPLANSTVQKRGQQLQLVQHVCCILSAMNLGASLCTILSPALARQMSALETMEPLDRHTMVLLYSTCFASARISTGGVSSSLDIPSAMVQDVLTLSSNVLLLSISESQPAENELLQALLKMVSVCQNVFEPLVRSLLDVPDMANSVSTEACLKNLRVMQLLVRAPVLRDGFSRHQKQTLALVQAIDTCVARADSTGSSVSGDIATLIRQLQGDLALVAVGK